MTIKIKHLKLNKRCDVADEHNKIVEETEIRGGEEYWSETTLLTTLKQRVTERGFGLWEFRDRY